MRLHLPCSLKCRIAPARHASTAVPNPFPFPSHRNPTPHQIFHLPRNAPASAIKARYYELVRLYHPDSPTAQCPGISPDTITLRFHSITAAYAALLGKKSRGNSSHESEAAQEAQERMAARWKAAKVRRYDFLESGGADEHWKEWVWMGAAVVTAIAFVSQIAWTRHRALIETRRHQLLDRRGSSPRSNDASSPKDSQ